MQKILGNLEQDHPYYKKSVSFFDEFFDELPFHNHVQSAIDNVLVKNIITQDECLLMFPNKNTDIMDSMIDYLNYKTIIYHKNFNTIGIKAILKSLIMFQITLKPNMPDNFKKIFNHIFLKTSPLKNIHRFYSVIDCLWYCTGDTATDYNYYSKRFLLGNIYLETIFYACSDTSDDYQNTENYLIRSFDKIKTIENLKTKIPNFNNIGENIASLLGKMRYR